MRLQTTTASKTNDLAIYLSAMTLGLIAVTARAQGLQAGDVKIVTTKKGIGFSCVLIGTILATLHSRTAMDKSSYDLLLSYAAVLSAGGEIYAADCQTLGWECLPAHVPDGVALGTPLNQWILQRAANGWYGHLSLCTSIASREHSLTIQAIAAAILVTRKLSGAEIEQIITNLA